MSNNTSVCLVLVSRDTSAPDVRAGWGYKSPRCMKRRRSTSEEPGWEDWRTESYGMEQRIRPNGPYRGSPGSNVASYSRRAGNRPHLGMCRESSSRA